MEIDGRTTCFAGDVVVEILSRLPVKSLLQFLCVSKEWHGLIKSSYFTANHLQNSDPNLSLHFKRKTPDSEDSVSLFRNESIHVNLDLPFINCPTMQFSFPLGSSNGLVGLILCDLRDEEQLEHIVVWNPATKQFRFLPETDDHYLMGLEFFRDIRDYKVVNILPSGLHNTIRAKVFTRSTDSWRKFKPAVEQRSHVLSFNLRDEVFHVIPLPEIISPRTALFSWKKSLAFLGGNKIDVQTLQSSAYQLSIAATSACLRKFGVSFPGFDHSDETLKLSSLLGPFIEIKVEACSCLW
ncbi:hypothetical protein ACLB2K_003467 [Fragaria x ananassa]